jgi:TPR repeat protein
MTLCLLRFATATILAHLGIARAQCALALIYYVGECVSRDPAKAAHWSSKAASQGNARGQLLLSDFQLIGFGVPKDTVGAFTLAEQAARQKDPRALHSLAWFYQQGVATNVDKQRALSLWKEAAELGYPAAQFAVAWRLFDDSGATRDVRAARDWCELAIRNGYDDPHGKELLAKIRAELGDEQPLDTAALPSTSGTRSTGAQLVARLKLAFVALQYAVLGLDRQTYHLRQSRTYEQAGDYERAAYHARSLLEISEHPETRARLAHSYAMLRRDADAVCEFRKAVAQWDHPGIMLGLAQAELRVGNIETARGLLKRIQASPRAHDLRSSIRDLQQELARVGEA